MKKLLSILGAIALLFIVGASSADWVDDIGPMPAGINDISAKFQPNGKDGVVILKTKTGDCVAYKVVNDQVVQTRKCTEPDWTDFTKKAR